MEATRGEANVGNAIELDFVYLPKINFALQQNAIALIQFMAIKNTRDVDLRNLKCSISL